MFCGSSGSKLDTRIPRCPFGPPNRYIMLHDITAWQAYALLANDKIGVNQPISGTIRYRTIVLCASTNRTQPCSLICTISYCENPMRRDLESRCTLIGMSHISKTFLLRNHVHGIYLQKLTIKVTWMKTRDLSGATKFNTFTAYR